MTTQAEAARDDRAGRSHVREFARGGAIGLVGSGVAAVAGFLLTVVVARVLGPAQTGVFFTVVALFMILTEVTELGADTGLVRTTARLRALGRVGDLRRVVVAALVPVLAVGAVTGLAVFALAPWLAGLLVDSAHHDDAVFLLRVCGPVLAVSAARNVALSGTRGMGSLAAFTVQANVITPLSRPVLVIAVATVGYGAGGVMVAWSLPIALTFVAAVAILWRLLRRAESEDHAAAGAGRAASTATGPDQVGPVAAGVGRVASAAAGGDGIASDGAASSAVREFWAFSGLRGVAAMLEIVVTWLGVPLVSAMVSSHDAGIYATAGRFITTGTLVLAATRLAVAPQIAGLLARGETRQAEDLNAVATGWIVAASWPLYLALAVFGPFVLTLFGTDFRGGAGAMAILACAMALVLATGNVQTVLLMGGKSSWNLIDKAVVVVLMVVLHLLLVPPFGIIGAATAWGVSMLVDNLLAVVQVRYLMGLRLRTRTLAPVGAWALVWFGGLGIVLRVLLGTGLPAFAAYAVLATGGYGAVLWRLRHVLQADVMVGALRSRGRAGEKEEG
ncbi:lipopolysaccharide biosynthesis protein [Actinoallomurus rhizosphaericola]|uniref:lipopolysaccharide biosynthesis protein n=1 Tax=Actinoallomurus rhizosphaericola TaxID=2952536 RepID=UPI002091A94C|nr:polysaccharide biosynthesis C-terminal domain-containing protein [Actinoallomurus rhizosphaericola]MCO5992794.1 polysaccharide biosynthesis C-terminal domain-containing protein [Actinoallomurus rhizosphaericola]